MTPSVTPSVPEKPDFLSIALPLIKRGFRVTPIHPLTKAGIMRNLHGTTDGAEVISWGARYPNHNVGVVSKRGPTRLMFFDDDAGIATQIEEECGQKIPRTYKVQTRPDTNQKKQHFYFKQTAYSFAQFAIFAEKGDPYHSKNVNRRDTEKFTLSRSGLQIHPTLYDLKCIGGVNLVVAAGSLRESGERYTCVDDSEPVDIPDWLVDWFIKDIRAYHAATMKEKAEKFTERIARQTFDVIAEEDIFDYLRYRAHPLVGLGLVGEGLENALTYLARTDCDKGETFVASEHGKEMIHRIASANWERGIATWFYRTEDLKSEVVEGHIMLYTTTTKHEVLEGIINEFPDRISTADAFERIEKGLKDEDYTFDAVTDRGMVYAARKRTGFAVQGHRWWIRTTPGVTA